MHLAIYKGIEYFAVVRGGKLESLYTPLSYKALEGFTKKGDSAFYVKQIEITDLKYLEAFYWVQYYAIYKGRRFEITYERNAKLERPDQRLRLITDDQTFMKEHGLFEGAFIVQHDYGHLYYATAELLLSDVELITKFRNVPIGEFEW